MSQTFHGITGWVRVGGTRVTESASGLKTALLNFQCAGITLSPPFMEGEALPAPFDSYVVYPTPSIGIGEDGISSCSLQAYSANLDIKRDELRKILLRVDGTFTNYYAISPTPQPVSMIASVLVQGAYVQDAQFTNNQSLPTTGITFDYVVVAAQTSQGQVPLTSSFIITGDFLVQSYSQQFLGSVINAEAIYQSTIVSCVATGSVNFDA